MPCKHPSLLAVFAIIFSFALTFFLPLTLSLPFGAQAQAQSKKADKHYQRAEKFLADKNYEKAVPLYEKAANLGDVRAQRQLGEMYEKGQGVAKDCTKAINWYSRVATQEQRNSSLQYKIGMLRSEENLCENYTMAAGWLGKAAELGHAKAQEALAELVEQKKKQAAEQAAEDDRRKAEDDRRKAEEARKHAEQGGFRAQLALAKMYEEGKGVGQNCAQAVRWYRMGVKEALSQIEFPEDQNDVSELLEKGRKLAKLAKLHEEGTKCLKKDRKKAIALYYKVLSIYTCPINHWRCFGGQRTARHALAKIFAVESEKTYRQAKALLDKENYKAAAPLLEKAAKQQHAKATTELGKMYFWGTGVELDVKKAVELYSDASRLEGAEAEYLLAGLYKAGCILSQSDSNAERLYKESAKHGDEDAKKALTLIEEEKTWSHLKQAIMKSAWSETISKLYANKWKELGHTEFCLPLFFRGD